MDLLGWIKGKCLWQLTAFLVGCLQAPSTMKSVIQAAWLLTVAFGNLIVIIVAEAKSKALSQVSPTYCHSFD